MRCLFARDVNVRLYSSHVLHVSYLMVFVTANGIDRQAKAAAERLVKVLNLLQQEGFGCGVRCERRETCGCAERCSELLVARSARMQHAVVDDSMGENSMVT